MHPRCADYDGDICGVLHTFYAPTNEPSAAMMKPGAELLRYEHCPAASLQPSIEVVLVTSDLNLQNKAAAVGLLHVEPPTT